MRVKCSQEYYMESLQVMSVEDLNIVHIETGAILQYISVRSLPVDDFPDLIEKRLKKIWAIGSGAT